MKTLLILLFCCSGVSIGKNTTEPVYALIIGINEYTKGKQTESRGGRILNNLQGAEHDARAFQSLVVNRFGVQPDQTTLLLNRQATRAAIERAMQDLIVMASAKPGQCVIFFAGHGSQVRNTASTEPGGMDETLVPADSRDGAPDIRDKEIRAWLNLLLDTGSSVTMVVDACHSGSVARSAFENTRSRSLAPAVDAISDDRFATLPAPETRGALILSAAQDWQLAKESFDGTSDHGIFTRALLEAFAVLDPATPVNQVFQSIRARMQANGETQEPVLGGRADRLEKPLLPLQQKKTGGIRVAVRAVWDKNDIELLGGPEAGLYPGVQLSGPENTVLEVSEKVAPGKSTARLLKGSLKAVSAGSLFQATQFPAIPEKSLTVHIPVLKNAAAVKNDIETVLRRASKNKVEVVSPDQISATDSSGMLLVYSDGAWMMQRGSRVQKQGKAGSFSASLIPAGVQKISIVTPPDAKSRNQILKNAATSGLIVVSAKENAIYSAFSYSGVSGSSFFWIKTGDVPLLPEMTKPEREVTTFATSLQPAASAFGWIKAAETPVDSRFPYKLALVRADNGELLENGHLPAQTSFGLLLKTQQNVWKQDRISPRYVYVFSMDEHGSTTLLFPALGNVENRFPMQIDYSYSSMDIPLTGTSYLSTGTTFEKYLIICLASETAIGDPSVFNRSGNGISAPETLQELISSGRRTLETPAWSITKIHLTSGALLARPSQH
jgi:hypothetical protein